MRASIEGLRPFGGLLRKFPPTPQCGFPLRGPAGRASIEGLRPFGGLLCKFPPTPQGGLPLRGPVVRASIEGLRPYGGLLCKFPPTPQYGFPLRGFAPSAVCFANFRLPRSAKLKKTFYCGNVRATCAMSANGKIFEDFFQALYKKLRMERKFYPRS